MAFTVVHQPKTKDVDFEEYARLLHRKGVDLARLPRTPEPGTGRRWLYVWNNQADAQTFAEELNKRTKDGAWEVVPVGTEPSEGPLGPIEVGVGRQSSGITFRLRPLSRLMIEKLFPGSSRPNSVFIGTETRKDFQKREDFTALAERVVPILTGLPLAQIKETFGGYRVYEPVAKKELAASAPIHV